MISALAFVARHFLLVCFAVLAGCVLWTIAYAVLLLVAVIGDMRVGGPLAYPGGIVLVIGVGVGLGWGVFAPASAIGAIFCRLLRLPRLAAIPVVFASAFALSWLFYGAFVLLITTHSMPSGWVVLKNFVMFLAGPLGVYWWLTEGPGALYDAFRRWIRSRHGRCCPESDAKKSAA